MATRADQIIVLKSDGNLWAWGSLPSGNGTTFDTSYRPNHSNGISNVGAISAGMNHILVVKTDGTVWASGGNAYGQLGDNTTTARTGFVQAAGLANITAVSSGFHSMALKSDGTVWTWGSNAYGQLGDNTLTNRLSPIQVTGLTNVTAIAAGVYHSVALKNDGTVYTWGENTFGQLGNGSNEWEHLPMSVTGLTNVVKIAASGSVTAALRSDGTVWYLGFGEYSVQQVPGITDAVAVGASEFQILIVRQNGTLWTWETPWSWSDVEEPTLKQVPGLAGVISAAGSEYHTAALLNDGTIYTWVRNQEGLASPGLGNGSQGVDTSVVQTSRIKNASRVTRSQRDTFVVTDEGKIFSWGTNEFGELGQGNTAPSYTPTEIQGVSGAIAVAHTGVNAAFVRADGTVSTMGWNASGQLGNNSLTNSSVPVSVSSLTGVTDITGGDRFFAALKSDGTVRAWGVNSAGQLGDNSTTTRKTPVQVSGLTTVTAIASGYWHTLALKTDGTVWAWGGNSSGELGDSSLTNRKVPVQVSGLTNVAAISAHGGQSMALRNDGTVWVWGSNFFGQVGDGTTTNRQTPFQIPGLSNVIEILASEGAFLVRKSDGSVWGWGVNAYGAADATLSGVKTAPVQIPSLTGITRLGKGSTAVRADGTVAMWGSLSGYLRYDASAYTFTRDIQRPYKAAIRLIVNPQDSDQDGIDDSWETLHFGGLTNNATPDIDGDGLVDIEEFVLGSNPTLSDTDADLLSDLVDPFPCDYYNGVAPDIVKLSGDGQTAAPGSFNAGPLEVGVAYPGPKLLVNAPVIFSVTTGDGKVASSMAGSLQSSVTVRTDSVGTARVYYKQGMAPNTSSTITALAGTSHTSFLSSSSSPNSDGNEFDDSWEMQYFNQLGVDPDDDPDGDGLSNIEEYLGVTSPTDYYNGIQPVVASEMPPDGSLFDGVAIALSVKNANGIPLVNAPVTLTVQGDDHGLSPTLAGRWDKARRTVIVRTDEYGIALAYVVRADELEVLQ